MPRLLLVLGAALFSTGGAAIEGCSLDGWQVAGARSGLAALTLLLLVRGARRRWRARTVLVGVANGTTLLLFVLANKYTTAADTILLQAAAPLYLLLMGPLFLKEAVRPADVLVLVVMAAGLVLVVLGGAEPGATAPDPVLGAWLAAACGFTWALTILGLRWTGRGTEDGNLVPTLVGNVLVFVVCLPLALPVESAPSEATLAVDLALLAWLGVFQIGVAYVCVLAGLRHVGALEASLLLLVEPVLNPVWAWIFHDERPGAWTVVGGALILAGTVAYGLRPRARVAVGEAG